MRYVATFFWTFLLTQMAAYVQSSMLERDYSFGAVSICAVVLAIFICVIGEISPSEKAEGAHH